MRLIAALLYTAAGMWLYSTFFPGPNAGFVIMIFVLLFSSVFLFNEGLLRKLKRQSFDDHLKEMDAKGLLSKEHCRSTRAIHYEDLDTGCSVYLVDLSGGGVLCLYGQYLFAYEPGTDEDETDAERKFPCEEFVLLKRKRDGQLLHIERNGRVFEPETIAQPDHRKLRDLALDMADGAIYSHVSFDELRSALA